VILRIRDALDEKGEFSHAERVGVGGGIRILPDVERFFI